MNTYKVFLASDGTIGDVWPEFGESGEACWCYEPNDACGGCIRCVEMQVYHYGGMSFRVGEAIAKQLEFYVTVPLCLNIYETEPMVFEEIPV